VRKGMLKKIPLLFELLHLRTSVEHDALFFEEELRDITKEDTPSLALLVSLREHIHDSREVFFYNVPQFFFKKNHRRATMSVSSNARVQKEEGFF
jgi:hypothetical protein